MGIASRGRAAGKCEVGGRDFSRRRAHQLRRKLRSGGAWVLGSVKTWLSSIDKVSWRTHSDLMPAWLDGFR